MSVVSSNGVNGVSSGSGDPSGRRRRMAASTRTGSSGTSASETMARLPDESFSTNCSIRRAPALARPSSGRASTAWLTTEAR